MITKLEALELYQNSASISRVTDKNVKEATNSLEKINKGVQEIVEETKKATEAVVKKSLTKTLGYLQVAKNGLVKKIEDFNGIKKAEAKKNEEHQNKIKEKTKLIEKRKGELAARHPARVEAKPTVPASVPASSSKN